MHGNGGLAGDSHQALNVIIGEGGGLAEVALDEADGLAAEQQRQDERAAGAEDILEQSTGDAIQAGFTRQVGHDHRAGGVERVGGGLEGIERVAGGDLQRFDRGPGDRDDPLGGFDGRLAFGLWTVEDGHQQQAVGAAEQGAGSQGGEDVLVAAGLVHFGDDIVEGFRFAEGDLGLFEEAHALDGQGDLFGHFGQQFVFFRGERARGVEFDGEGAQGVAAQHERGGQDGLAIAAEHGRFAGYSLGDFVRPAVAGGGDRCADL